MKGNKKLILAIAVITVAFVSIFLIKLGDSVATFEHNNLVDSTTKVILIDPGHGGIDGGACSDDGVCEKNINLSIALKLEERLKKDGYKVLLTRYEDVGLYTEGKSVREKKIQDLNKRVQMKKDTQCDMFISIHLNTFPQASVKGAQVWYSRNEGSAKIAELMQSNLITDLDPSNHRKPKPAEAHYKVLRNNDIMPGVIVECGFLSNYDETRKLKEEDYQNKIADSLYKSVDMYFKNGGN